MKKTLIILFIFILSSILLADEFKIDNKKEIKAGKLKEQGYEIVIQKNTFDTEETRDTVYLNISSYNPSNGHRIYITVTCHANGSETEATYVYEYKK